ncbi:MAG: hypothetical protein ACI9JM_002221 [Halioglobus sp.]|jgi:hypothetical protein
MSNMKYTELVKSSDSLETLVCFSNDRICYLRRECRKYLISGKEWGVWVIKMTQKK